MRRSIRVFEAFVKNSEPRTRHVALGPDSLTPRNRKFLADLRIPCFHGPETPCPPSEDMWVSCNKSEVLRFVVGYPLRPNLNLNAVSVKQAIQALGANVVLAS
jgi:hypothetical protein